jgi:hypothetical protein
MNDQGDFFPYFLVVIGVIVLSVGAYAPQGNPQDLILTTGAGLASGGLVAYKGKQPGA